MFEKIFLQILNMSFTASFVIILVLIARLLLKKSPKGLSYALWGVVLFRLICPFSFESMFSLLPAKINPISQDIVYAPIPTIDTGIPAINHTVNQLLPAATPAASVNPLQIWVFIGTMVWLLGMAILLIYSIVSLVKLQMRLKNAVHEKDNIYLAEHLDTPFVMGIIRPKIYLPASLTEREKRYILLHEQMHIRRFDHVIKIVSFFVLCLHWFNPLVWIAFFISGKDMEMSCDEAVIKQLGSNVKKEYSSSLLTLATGRRIIGGSPLAFGEGDTKGRIKNVLNYKKPAFWVLITSFLIVVVLGFGLATNQKINRSFEMSGNHLSDLHPGEIVRNIATIIKADTRDIEISPDNFGLTVSSDFSWVNDEAIRILFAKNEKHWNTSQLRIFIDDFEFFVTEPSNWVAYEGQVFSLQAYLEALKYLPQKEIASLCKESPQRYAIELSENDRKLNADRCLYYNKDGVTENNGWHIRLDIQPLYVDNESSFTGVGTDIIHVFYNGNNSTDAILDSAEELWKARTKYIGDNSAVGKLIGLLPVPKGLQYDHFKLHTSERPYEIEIVYAVPTEELKKYDTESTPVVDIFRKNSLLLLALVDNAEGIRAVLTDGKREVGFINGREWADYTVGGDVRNYADSPEKLQELILFKVSPLVDYPEGYSPEQKNDNNAHLRIDKAEVVEIQSKNSILVKIKNELEHEKDEYTFTNGDIVSIIYSEENQRAIDFIRKLHVGSIVNISRYNTTKPKNATPYMTLECSGIDIYDDKGENIVEFF
mgnify:CR=1 FL=1